jgi:hypothetical protein
MTKEQYQHCVQYDHGQILYSMYQEKFDSKKHHPFLQFQQFMLCMQMSGMLSTYFERACQYYEQKFGINRLYSKDGTLIAFV